MGEKLKPCPFCGSTDLFIEVLGIGVFDGDETVVICNNCEARGPVRYCDEDKSVTPEGKWNKRHD